MKIFQLKSKSSLLYLMACLIIFSCGKENISETKIESTTENVHSKLLTINDGANEATIKIKASNPDVLDLLTKDVFEFKALDRINEPIAKNHEQLVGERKFHFSEATDNIKIEILEATIPDHFLGYELQIKPSNNIQGKSAAADWWEVSNIRGNRRRVSVTINGADGFARNDYTTCDEILTFIPADPTITVVNDGQERIFPLRPSNLGINRIRVGYDKNLNPSFGISFYYQGSCSDAEGCATEGDAACDEVRLDESPVTNQTLSAISAFVASEMKYSIRNMLLLYVQHQGELEILFSENNDLQIAVHEFLQENSSFLANAFANDETLIEKRHIKHTKSVLDLAESKTKNKVIVEHIQSLKKALTRVEGMELKDALRMLDKEEMK